MNCVSFKAWRSLAAPSGCAALAAALTGIVSSVHASAWNGEQPGTMTGGNIFSVSGNTVTITAAAAKTFLSVPNNSISNQQLLGINAFYIVTTSGTVYPGILALPTMGKVQTPNVLKDWAINAVGDPAGYDGGNGYGNKTPWLQLASDADLLAGSGKSPSGYTLGTFTFGVPIPANATWGIDYLVGNGAAGQTGRTYSTITGFRLGGTGGGSDVPEPGAVAFGIIFGLGVVGGVVRARRNA